MARSSKSLRVVGALFAAIVAVASGLVFGSQSSQAAAEPFTLRWTENVRGDFKMIGNTQLRCPDNATGCIQARQRTVPTNGNIDNNHYNMRFVDTDADDETFNSSSAQLSVPAGADILKAYLFWSGDTDDVQGSSYDPPPEPDARERVLFRVPGRDYAEVVADKLYTIRPNDSRFQGVADVTEMVRQGDGNGEYWLANLQAGRGDFNYGGWAMYVFYEHPSEPWRNLSLFDGIVMVGFANPEEEITVSGFRTPAAGPVRGALGMLVWEGDISSAGDRAFLKQLGVPDSQGSYIGGTQNPSGNLFNSSQVDLGTINQDRNPSWQNLFGVDIDKLNLNDILGNNASAAVFRFVAEGDTPAEVDTYTPGAVAFAFETQAPELELVKSVEDVNGGPLRPGDVLRYTVEATSLGPDDATGIVLRDAIPEHTSYVPGSLQVVSGPNAGAKTDAAADDQAEYDAGAGEVVFRLGVGANASQGGQLDVGQTTAISFDVEIEPGAVAGTEIRNLATATNTGPSTGTEFDSESNEVISEVEPMPADPAIAKTANGPFVAGQQASFTLVVSNAGEETYDAGTATVSDTLPAGLIPTAASGPGWNCTIIGQTVGCQRNDSLAAGDSWPPITITVDVAADAAPGPRTNTAVVTAPDDINPANNSDDAELEIERSADLEVEKSVSPGTADPGGTVTYTLVVRNNGPSDEPAAVLADDVPAGLDVRSVSPGQGTCQLTGNQLTCELGALAAGAEATVEIGADVLPVLSGQTVPNTAEVSGEGPDPVPDNNTDDASFDVRQLEADLEITKTASTGAVLPGEQFTYTLEVANLGPDAAQDVEVSDAVPAAFEVLSVSSDAGTCTQQQSFRCQLGALAFGETAEIEVTVEVAADAEPGEHENTATVETSSDDPNPDNDSDTETVEVEPYTDVAIAKTASEDAVAPGQAFTYTLEVTNNGPSAAENVSVSDAVPAIFEVQDVSTDTGSCTTEQNFTCDLGTLTAGATAEITVSVITDSGADAGSVENTAEVQTTSNDVNPDNDSDQAAVEITDLLADLAVQKQADQTRYLAGDVVSYTITVENLGPDVAENVQLADELPDPLQLISVTSADGDCSGDPQIVCELGDLAVGDQAEVVIETRIPAGADAGTILNAAQATTTSADPNPDNDTDEAEIEVDLEADLEITKTANTQQVEPGGTVIYTLEVANNGPTRAENVVVSDAVPAELIVLSASSSVGTCTQTQSFTCELGDLGPNAPATITLEVAVAPSAAGQITNTAGVSSDTDDPNPANDSDSDMIEVDEVADLEISKEADPLIVSPGEEVTYTLIVRNNGPSQASGVEVADPLAAGLEFVGADPEQGTCSPGAPVSCQLGSMASGEEVAIEITVQVATDAGAGPITNTAQVDSLTTDPIPANNSDDAEITVIVPGEADLQVEKTASVPSVLVGEQLSFEIVVRNIGDETAENVRLNDELPAAFGLVEVNPQQGSCDVAVPLECELGEIDPGDQVSVEVIVLAVGPTGDHTNTAAAASDTPESNLTNNSDEATVLITSAESDLAATKEVVSGGSGVGERITYRLTVTNNGPDPAENATMADTLPPQLHLEGLIPISANAVCQTSGNTAICTADSLGVGESMVAEVEATVLAAGLIENTVIAGSDSADPNPDNNEDEALVDVSDDSDPQDPADPGDPQDPADPSDPRDPQDPSDAGQQDAEQSRGPSERGTSGAERERGQLPFTGLELGLGLAASAALIGLGLYLRRRGV